MPFLYYSGWRPAWKRGKVEKCAASHLLFWPTCIYRQDLSFVIERARRSRDGRSDNVPIMPCRNDTFHGGKTRAAPYRKDDPTFQVRAQIGFVPVPVETWKGGIVARVNDGGQNGIGRIVVWPGSSKCRDKMRDGQMGGYLLARHLGNRPKKCWGCQRKWSPQNLGMAPKGPDC